MAGLDYVGVRQPCGCTTAWLAAEFADHLIVRRFQRDMRHSGRRVKRMTLDDARPGLVTGCPHVGLTPTGMRAR